jgi:prevent-host-death family protein
MTVELSLTAARAELPDVVNRAEAGEVTYITRHGQRVAAIVPTTVADSSPATAAERQAQLASVVDHILAEDAGLLKRLAES